MVGCASITRHGYKRICAVVSLVMIVSCTAFFILLDQKLQQNLIPAAVWSGRDILEQELWLERDQSDRDSTAFLPTVHYLWCRKEKFQFRHYLTLLSVLRVLHPTKIVFHYVYMPLTDNYNNWFDELLASVFGLELHQIPSSQCEGTDIFKTASSFIDLQAGGFFIGSDVILARHPTFRGTDKAWFAAGQGHNDPTKVIMAVKGGLHPDLLSDSTKPTLLCVSPEQVVNTSDCVAMDTRDLFPRDVMADASPFAELARWLFYGKRAPQVARRDPNNPIPRTSHYIKLKKHTGRFAVYSEAELAFNHYLSILSALYVAGFQQVYFHAEEEPTGKWWEELVSKENVSFIPLDPPSSVYQQPVDVVQHTADLARYLLLEKYGGVYQDMDVIWASHLPDSLMQLPAVMGLDWVKDPNNYPEIANAGVIMVSRGSTWLKHLMKTHRDYRDGEWSYNSGLMPYRMYELYPDSVRFDPHLQVICFSPTDYPPIRCHPTWEENYARRQWDRSPTLKITDWEKDVRAFHITQPKPHPSLSSAKALAKAVAEKKGLFSKVGYNVLEKSGRLHLLKL